MCLAEALMRIPDTAASRCFKSVYKPSVWQIGNPILKTPILYFVNASTWGLMLTGKVVTLDAKQDGTPTNVINRLVNKKRKCTEPVIRQKRMPPSDENHGASICVGRNIDEAMKTVNRNVNKALPILSICWGKRH